MNAEPVFEGARLFAQIAQDLCSQVGYEQSAQRVVQLAQDLTECDAAGIWTFNKVGHAVLHAASDPSISELEDLVNKARAGVGWSCLQEKATLCVEDFRTDSRWPLYRRWLEKQDRPMISAAGYSLQVEDRIVGALVLWSRRPAHFTEHRLNLGAVFAEHATISLQLATVEDTAANLQMALDSNRRIGVALGIVMIEYRVTERAAFDMLRTISQHGNRKLRDVAEEVAFTGVLPDVHLDKRRLAGGSGCGALAV